MSVLSRFRAQGLVWPTVASSVALAILVGLGSWQLQRKTWKENLIATISERLQASAVDLSDVEAQLAEGRPVDYVRLRVSGAFEHDKERYYYAPHAKLGPGFHVYTPLKLAGAESRYLWVNRGYVAEAFRKPAARVAGQVEGEVQLTGVIRGPGKKGTFSPAHDETGNTWYWRDLTGMHESAFGADTPGPVPFFIDAELGDGAAKDGRPRGGVTIVKLPNRHLEYAYTWFGLAATLIGVYLAFVFSRLRRRPA